MKLGLSSAYFAYFVREGGSLERHVRVEPRRSDIETTNLVQLITHIFVLLM